MFFNVFSVPISSKFTFTEVMVQGVLWSSNSDAVMVQPGGLN